MNLVCDEGVDRPVVERLRRDGHEVVYVAEMAPGITDEAVLADALGRQALLIVSDKDFGELVFRQRRSSAGVVLLRLGGMAPDDKARLVAASVREHGAQMIGSFSVISPHSIRIRSTGEASGSD